MLLTHFLLTHFRVTLLDLQCMSGLLLMPLERYQYGHRKLRIDQFTRDRAIKADAAQWAALGALIQSVCHTTGRPISAGRFFL
jgi:hypothetical protein